MVINACMMCMGADANHVVPGSAELDSVSAEHKRACNTLLNRPGFLTGKATDFRKLDKVVRGAKIEAIRAFAVQMTTPGLLEDRTRSPAN